MSHIFKGNTAACLRHLAAAIGSDNTKRDIVARFADVDSGTVRRWFKSGRVPIGETLIRARFYMEFLGYEVEEVQVLNPVIRSAAEMLAFGASTIPEIVKFLGYTEGKVGVEAVLAVFRGAQGVSPKRYEDLKILVELNQELTEGKKKATQRISFEDVQPRHHRSVQAPLPPRLRLGERSPLNLRQLLIESAAKQVEALLPLAQAIESDEFTAEERAKLRELAGGNGVFKLANTLSRLCGERSRAMHSSQQQPV